jgi:hypothetical protein
MLETIAWIVLLITMGIVATAITFVAIFMVSEEK